MYPNRLRRLSPIILWTGSQLSVTIKVSMVDDGQSDVHERKKEKNRVSNIHDIYT